MIDRMTLGHVPPKHHRVLPIDGPGGAPYDDGAIAYEHCFTRRGFDDAYTILYQRWSPARESTPVRSQVRWRDAAPADDDSLHRMHLLSDKAPVGGTWLESRTPLLLNTDVIMSVARPDVDEPRFFCNGDGDELIFFFKGGARLETPFGVQDVKELDYLWIPRACPYRLTLDAHRPDDGPHHVLIFEMRGNLAIPKQFRNPAGQLTFDAPYSHRDFGRPIRLVDAKDDDQPVSDARWVITTKRNDHLTDRILDRHPCDIVGWDGCVYPVTFPILNYQPKTGKYHLPPTIHITFSGRDAIVCSFVPRKVDYGDGAIPCPYPHSSVDCDEVLFYVKGHFTSRKGVGPGSISLHPAGLPHAPQPGSYERSIGTTETDELAVMMDTFKRLVPTVHAKAMEDPDYMGTWSPEHFDESGRQGPDKSSDDEVSYSQ